MALKVQTTEIHLLLNDAAILNGNKFWLKVYRNGIELTSDVTISYNIDVAQNGTNTNIITIDQNRLSYECGMITAMAIGWTYLQVTYFKDTKKEENLLLKVFVHDKFERNGTDIIFHSGYDRLTTYASESNSAESEGYSKYFYKPTIFAKFNDGGLKTNLAPNSPPGWWNDPSVITYVVPMPTNWTSLSINGVYRRNIPSGSPISTNFHQIYPHRLDFIAIP